MKKLILFIATHAIALAIGFAAGVYFLPILAAPSAPTVAEVEHAAARAAVVANFAGNSKAVTCCIGARESSRSVRMR
jgi:hypothetical protein